MVKKWIQKTGMKKGALHSQLGIPKEKDIPMNLLNKIISAKAGEVIKNPSKTGKKTIKITALLKKRVNLAKNLKKI